MIDMNSNPADVAKAIKAMTPAKVGLLVTGLKRQHPHFKSEAEVRAMLRAFVARHG